MRATRIMPPMTTGCLTLISGPPGAGKTTVAESLAERATRSVHLPSDSFWNLIRRGRVEPWLPQAETQNGVVIDALVAASMTFVLGGYAVFLDGVVGPWFIDRFRSAASETSRQLHYVVLRPADTVCLTRAVSRQPFDPLSEPLREEGVIVELCRQFRHLGPYEANAVDTSSLTVLDTVATIEEGLDLGRYRLS